MKDRAWVAEAVRRIEADFNRSADTHLFPMRIAAYPGVDVYLKDESSYLIGSLKHQLARSLFLYGLCNGWIREGTTVIEASSGSTAVSEAYFARLLGLDFVECDRVVPAVVEFDETADTLAAIQRRGVIGEGPVSLAVGAARGLLQLRDAEGRPIVLFAVPAPVKMSAQRQWQVRDDRVAERSAMRPA